MKWRSEIVKDLSISRLMFFLPHIISFLEKKSDGQSFWWAEVEIFGQSINGEFSIKRHKTLMFHRSEPNLVFNE